MPVVAQRVTETPGNQQTTTAVLATAYRDVPGGGCSHSTQQCESIGFTMVHLKATSGTILGVE